jgi:hypothetical protein
MFSGRFLVVLPRLGVDLGGDGWWLKVFSANVFQDRPGGLKLSVGGVGVVVMDPQASPPFPPSLPGTVLDRLRVLGEEVAALGDAELWRLSDAESVEAVRRSFVLLQQYEFVRLGLVLDLDQRPGVVATVRTGTTARSFLRGVALWRTSRPASADVQAAQVLGARRLVGTGAGPDPDPARTRPGNSAAPPVPATGGQPPPDGAVRAKKFAARRRVQFARLYRFRG